ncbi:MAG: metallophosphoesterase [Alphaproteobacteria bacterium]|nr:metallophosphoesterase [Alphaproteobacteria bacterium]MBQ8677893.1 metallophosphoesterase [Alphaproteobacteria bacterium]
MFFLIASMIVGIAASAVTIKTLIGYTTLSWWVKTLVSLMIIFCWFGHNAVWYLRHNQMVSLSCYSLYSTIAYIGLGFGFILLALLIMRDFGWFTLYGFAKTAKISWYKQVDPYNFYYLNRANLITVGISCLLVIWGIYEAVKFPEIKELTIYDAKIKESVKIVQMNDLHINRTTSVKKIENLVERINKLNPDVVVLVGDIVDERKPELLSEQLSALAQLKTKFGIYTVFGNHDFYSGLFIWLQKFIDYGLGPLFNNGAQINDNIYIAGVPDKSIAQAFPQMKINLPQALTGNKNNLYTILLSHTPKFTDEKISGIDLQLSGHTHGGQIFPFHFLVKSANKYLAGLYQEDGYKVYVSRGAGYWGPPIRLFAPSDITIINLKPKK